MGFSEIRTFIIDERGHRQVFITPYHVCDLCHKLKQAEWGRASGGASYLPPDWMHYVTDGYISRCACPDCIDKIPADANVCPPLPLYQCGTMRPITNEEYRARVMAVAAEAASEET